MRWTSVLVLLLAGACAPKGECDNGSVRCAPDLGAVQVCDCAAAEYFWLPLPWCKEAPRWMNRECPPTTTCTNDAEVGYVCINDRLAVCDDAHAFGACLSSKEYAQCALPPIRNSQASGVHKGILTRVRCPEGTTCDPDRYSKTGGAGSVCTSAQ